MAETTTIAWCQHTFNPWEGCTKVSPGCTNCYAETRNKRWGNDNWGPGKVRRRTTKSYWRGPIKWDADAKAKGERHRVFCASLADVFDAEAPEGALNDLWALIRATPNLDWLLLTKRPERIAASLPGDWGAGYGNVWLGTSVENQEYANKRIPILAAIPAKIRFLSCEPLLGPIDLQATEAGDVTTICNDCEDGSCDACGGLGRIHWVIVGGESGTGCRIMEAAWVDALYDSAGGAAWFYKQTGELVAKVMGYRNKKGEDLEEVRRSFTMSDPPAYLSRAWPA